MTAASNLRIVPFLSVFATLLLSLTISFRPQAATTERIVVDRHSGIALGGFDPVAYFVDADAMRGKGEFEHAFAGVVWRFRNEGNRAAFADDPKI